MEGLSLDNGTHVHMLDLRKLPKEVARVVFSLFP